jgi:8-oxo-dGTP diphosphatase
MKRYVVGFVFDYDMKNVLMLNRIKDPYKGKFNGVGGKIENNELPYQAMIRELEEETGYLESDMIKNEHLMTIIFPNNDIHIQLNIFYHILKKEIFLSGKNQKVINEGTLTVLNIQKEKLLHIENNTLAGDGNVTYFIYTILVTENR